MFPHAPVRCVRPLPDERGFPCGVQTTWFVPSCLHDLLAKDPTWRLDCAALAASKDAEVRTVGLSLLLELGVDTAIVHAQQSLGDKAWALRSAAYRYLSQFRDVASIPLLIARVEREEGRLAAELSQALFVHTGTRCFSKADWEHWWQQNKVAFALPHAESEIGRASCRERVWR